MKGLFPKDEASSFKTFRYRARKMSEQEFEKSANLKILPFENRVKDNPEFTNHLQVSH